MKLYPSTHYPRSVFPAPLFGAIAAAVAAVASRGRKLVIAVQARMLRADKR